MPLLTGNAPAKTSPQQAQGTNAAPNDKQAPAMVVPFIRASDEHLQPASFDKSGVITAAAQDLGISDVPAYGYLAWLYVMVEATGGTGTAAVAREDAPWNILQNITLSEPNGAPIVQFNDGYQMYLANKFGGYLNPVASDPKRSPLYQGVQTSGNFKFILRVPVSVSVRDAVGSQANQDSAGQFKFRATVAPNSTVYSANPTGAPNFRVRAWMTAYDQPEPVSAGVSNQVEPPANGTTSFWTVQSGIPIANGNNTVVLTRKGNYLRQLIFVLRGSGSRATGEPFWPDELRFMRDAFPARYYQFDVWKHIMFERTGYTGTADAAGAPENGVRFHDYMHEFDGALGRENRDQWQPTRNATRLELHGSFNGASTMDIIYNDVAVAQDVFI